MPRLQAASWIQFEAAKKLVAMAGLDLNKLFEQAQAKDFKPIELRVRLQAGVVSQLRPFVARNVLPPFCRGSGEAVLYRSMITPAGAAAVSRTLRAARAAAWEHAAWEWVAYFSLARSEEHTSELQSRFDLVCRLLLEKKKQ